MKTNWEILNATLHDCQKCPRLVDWRERVAEVKRKAYKNSTYWGKPVPGFGDLNAEILILGLAPGAHGSNRTGRMFTGDASGDFLFPALFEAGFCSQPNSISIHDGMRLKNIYITAVCRCVPPKNKPSREEMENCRTFLADEIQLLKSLKGIVALGQIAFSSAISLIQQEFGHEFLRKPKFAHGAFIQTDEIPIWLLSSYHPSRQNTQTGRLTRKMFDSIWEKTDSLTGGKIENKRG